jgi:hypothetical protein
MARDAIGTALKAGLGRGRRRPGLTAMDEKETREYFESRVRSVLGISPEQFIRDYRAGRLPDTSRVHSLAMLTGETLRARKRSRQRADHRKEPVGG